MPINDASLNTGKDRAGRASGLVITWFMGRLDGLERPWELSAIAHTLPCASLPSGCSSVTPFYNKLAV